MTAFVQFEVRGADLVSRLFNRTARRIEDPRPSFRQIADYLRRVETEQFASGGGRSGGWEPLHQGTVRQKGNDRILIATGALMRSLTGKGRGRAARVSKRQLVFGTRLHYARFVNRRRPLIDLNQLDARRMAQIMGSSIVHE